MKPSQMTFSTIEFEGTMARERLQDLSWIQKRLTKYIWFVKEQQQKGLPNLKGKNAGDGDGAGGFNYKVDLYSLRSGDYVVHKKVGIGRFVGIKIDVPKDSTEPIEYVLIGYADGMAKLPLKQVSRLLYRHYLQMRQRGVKRRANCVILVCGRGERQKGRLLFKKWLWT